MKKYFLFLGLSFSFLSASISETKGIANFKKTCKECHGTAFYVAKVRTEDEWLELFENKGKMLFDAHKDNAKAVEKLTSTYYLKRLEDLKMFLAENGSDMGTVPPCNSTTCGFNVKLLKKSENTPTKSLFKKAK